MAKNGPSTTSQSSSSSNPNLTLTLTHELWSRCPTTKKRHYSEFWESALSLLVFSMS